MIVNVGEVGFFLFFCVCDFIVWGFLLEKFKFYKLMGRRNDVMLWCNIVVKLRCIV